MMNMGIERSPFLFVDFPIKINIYNPYILNYSDMASKTHTGLEAHKSVKKSLEMGDWANGYQFRHSEYFFLSNLNTKVDSDKKQVVINFRVEYKTKAHLVYNDVVWKYPYDLVDALTKDMESLELQILKYTSDPDRTDQVFSKRFNQKLFEERDYESKGWVIKR